MKQFNWAIMLSAVGVTFSATAWADEAAESRRTVDKSGEFSYVAPLGWLTAAQLTDHAHDVLFLPADDGKHRNVVIVDEKLPARWKCCSGSTHACWPES